MSSPYSMKNHAAGLPASRNLRLICIAVLGAALALITGVTLATAPAADAAKARSSATPKRIVALTPFTANTLGMLGVRPAGIGQTLGGDRRAHARLRNVRVLPLSHPNGPNLEQLASLNPDTVLSSSQWRKGHQAMKQLGIRVHQLDPPTLNSIPSRVKRISRLVGRKRAGNRLAVRMRRQIAKSRQGIRKRPNVLLILGVGRTPYAFMPNSWGGDLLRKAGANLLTSGLSSRGGYARISDEVVIQRNPEIIIAVPHANEDDIPGIQEYLRSNPAWQSTRAVRNNRVYISVDNSLLQAGTDVAKTIRKVRSLYLKNR